MNKLNTVVIALAALLIIFVDNSIWRAISITSTAMLICIFWIDSMALTRVKAYHQQLISVDKPAKD